MLRWLITTLGMSALRAGATSAAGAAGRSALMMAVLALLWLTAFGIAVAALSVWLASALGTVLGLAAVAALLALAGLAVYVGMRLAARRSATPMEKLSAAVGDGVAAAEVNSLGSLGIVAVAGYLLARQMRR